MAKRIFFIGFVLAFAELRVTAAANLIRGPYLQSGSSTSIVVRWRTDVPTDSRVVFWATDQPTNRAGSQQLTTEHEIKLAPLVADTIYFYSVGTSSNVLAAGANCYFHTSPTNARPVRVWVIGDAGDGSANQLAVRDAYMAFSNSASTHVWLMLGDNAYEIGSDEEFQTKVFDVYSDMFRRSVAWPAIGNHEMLSGREPIPYLEMFTLPTNGEAGGVPSRTELYYSYDYANVHFVCLDSEVSDRSSNGPMLNWLRTDLAATSKDWIIAYWHHAPYSAGPGNSDQARKMIDMRERVVPVLESYGVDLVLCGHSHVYERSFLLSGHYGYSWNFVSSNALSAGLGRKNDGGSYRKPAGGMGANRGTVYVVCGNSGAGGTLSFPQHPAMAVKFDGSGSVVLDINGLLLDAKYLRPNGDVDDYFTIDKSALPSAGPRSHFTRMTNGTLISWPTSSREFALEWSPSILGTNWQPVPHAKTIFGRSNLVNITTTNPSAFFRLRSVP